MKVKKNAGIAIGNTRLDGVKVKSGRCKTSAERARERMAARGGTDEIVKDMLGGINAAGNQAREYERLLDNIRAGNGTGKGSRSLSEAARDRMIARENKKGINEADTKDLGNDKAKRRAYPGSGGK